MGVTIDTPATRKILVLPLVALSLVLALAAPAAAAPRTRVITLPGASSVEALAAGKGGVFYAGDLFRGDIFQGDTHRGTVERFIDVPDGTMTVGMDLDVRHDLLFVAGGPGKAFVYNTRTRALVASYDLGDPLASFINDHHARYTVGTGRDTELVGNGGAVRVGHRRGLQRRAQAQHQRKRHQRKEKAMAGDRIATTDRYATRRWWVHAGLIVSLAVSVLVVLAQTGTDLHIAAGLCFAGLVGAHLAQRRRTLRTLVGDLAHPPAWRTARGRLALLLIVYLATDVVRRRARLRRSRIR